MLLDYARPMLHSKICRKKRDLVPGASEILGLGGADPILVVVNVVFAGALLKILEGGA